jgi:uncharacterized protein (DUF433 family)
MSLTIAADPVPLSTNAGGVILVSHTRVTLEAVVTSFNQGATAENIAEQFPSLGLADVCAVIKCAEKISASLLRMGCATPCRFLEESAS